MLLLLLQSLELSGSDHHERGSWPRLSEKFWAPRWVSVTPEWARSKARQCDWKNAQI